MIISQKVVTASSKMKCSGLLTCRPGLHQVEYGRRCRVGMCYAGKCMYSTYVIASSVGQTVQELGKQMNCILKASSTPVVGHRHNPIH